METGEVKHSRPYKPLRGLSHRQRKRKRNGLRALLGFSIIAASTALAYVGQRQWLDNNPDVPVQLPVFFTVSIFFLVSAAVEFVSISRRCNKNAAALSPYRTFHKSYARSMASDTRLNKRMTFYLLLLSGAAWMDFSQCFVAAWEVITSNFDIISPDSNFDHFLYASIIASGVFFSFNWGMALLQLYWCQNSHQRWVDDIKQQSCDMQKQYKSLILPYTFSSQRNDQDLQIVHQHLANINKAVALQINKLISYDMDRQKYFQCSLQWVIKSSERLIYGVLLAFRSIFLYGDLLQTNSTEAVREMIKHGGAIVLFSYYIYMNGYISSEIDIRKQQLENEYRAKVVNNLGLLKDNVIAVAQLLDKSTLSVPPQFSGIINAINAKSTAHDMGRVNVPACDHDINKQLLYCLNQIKRLLKHYEKLHDKTKLRIYFECCSDIRLVLDMLTGSDSSASRRQSRYLEQRDHKIGSSK
ncbi:MAG: hypothetical protein P1U40_12610 [Coxiellaceae bacterium]|nr:hypothetical protein [Coxiellaceae bacterium]